MKYTPCLRYRPSVGLGWFCVRILRTAPEIREKAMEKVEGSTRASRDYAKEGNRWFSLVNSRSAPQKACLLLTWRSLVLGACSGQDRAGPGHPM